MEAEWACPVCKSGLQKREYVDDVGEEFSCENCKRSWRMEGRSLVPISKDALNCSNCKANLQRTLPLSKHSPTYACLVCGKKYLSSRHQLSLLSETEFQDMRLKLGIKSPPTEGSGNLIHPN